MYSSEYTSGFPGPAASHLAAPPSPRHEGNVEQAPSDMLNPGLVNEGWCWWYRKYAAGDTVLEELEKEARKDFAAKHEY
jgi:hypothetical protein